MKRLIAWLGVLRLWSLTASTIPVLLGATLAAQNDLCSWTMLALTLMCGWLLQIATNLLNTYGDFRAGVDNAKNLPNAPQLVTGALQPHTVLRAGLCALLLATGLGLTAAALSDWRLLFFAAAGVAGVGGYTTGVRYKYMGLGVLAVFLLMGTLMVLASYYAQTCTLSWKPFFASIPIACLVAAILHGNDLRDSLSDRKAKIKTTTLILGDRNARMLFYALHLTPYLVVGASIVFELLPVWSLLTLLTLPLTISAIHACATGFRTHDTLRIGKLEGLSAGTHFVFGTLLIIGLLLANY